MKTVWTLTKVRLRALFSTALQKAKKASGAKKVLLTVLFAVLFLYVGVVFFAMGVGLSVALAALAFDVLETPPLYFALMATLALLIMILTGMFTAKGELFEPKDNDLLLSMPLSPYQILLSRMTGLYLSDLLFESFLLVPAFFVWFFFAKVTVLGVLFYLLGALLLPLLALSVSSLLGFVLAYVSSKCKNKTLPQTVLAVLFLVAYFVLVSDFDAILEKLLSNAQSVASALRRYAYPLYAFGQGCEGRVLPFLVFFLCCALPMALCLWLLSRSFFKLATAPKAVRRATYIKEKGERGSRSPLWAFTCKELKRLVSCSAYMLNGAMSQLMLVLAGVALLLKGADLLALFEVDPAALALLEGGTVAMFAAPVGFFVIAITIISGVSISLEAKTLWIPLSSPVPARLFLHAKTLAQALVCAPFVLFFAIAASIALRASVGMAILLALALQLFSLLCAQVGTFINLHFPKFDWPSETVAVKQSLSSFLVILAGMGLSLVFTVSTAVLGLLFFPALGVAATTALLAGACAGMYLLERASGGAFSRLLSRS